MFTANGENSSFAQQVIKAGHKAQRNITVHLTTKPTKLIKNKE